MKPNSSKFKIGSSFIGLLVFLLFLCFTEVVSGQPLNYTNLSFSAALVKAGNANQIVFVQLDSDCDQCNSVANDGLSGNEIGELFGKFVCIKVGYNTNDYNKIIFDYRISRNLPSSLFVDSNGNYLASMLNRSTTNQNEYIKLAANALASEKKPPFKIYLDALSEGKCDKGLLKQFINILNEKNFNASDLIEKYVGTLTLKELEDTTELKFLIRTAPIVNSKLDKLIRFNSELFKKVFESIPFDERVRINQKVVAKSKEKAILEKDQTYMYEVSSFLAGTYKDYKTAQKATSSLQMDYFKATKDSSQYLRYVKQYYDSNFKHLKMDSVCKAEMNHFIKRPDGAIIKGGPLYQIGNQLNDMAFSLLELSHDQEFLGFALKLSEQTLRYNYPPYIDTYAQILYKLGGRKDAIDWQQKAVDLSDSLHQPGNQLKEVLEKMKNGTL